MNEIDKDANKIPLIVIPDGELTIDTTEPPKIDETPITEKPAPAKLPPAPIPPV